MSSSGILATIFGTRYDREKKTADQWRQGLRSTVKQLKDCLNMLTEQDDGEEAISIGCLAQYKTAASSFGANNSSIFAYGPVYVLDMFVLDANTSIKLDKCFPIADSLITTGLKRTISLGITSTDSGISKIVPIGAANDTVVVHVCAGGQLETSLIDSRLLRKWSPDNDDGANSSLKLSPIMQAFSLGMTSVEYPEIRPGSFVEFKGGVTKLYSNGGTCGDKDGIHLYGSFAEYTVMQSPFLVLNVTPVENSSSDIRDITVLALSSSANEKPRVQTVRYGSALLCKIEGLEDYVPPTCDQATLLDHDQV